MTPVTNWTLELDSLVSFPDSFFLQEFDLLQKSDLDQIFGFILYFIHL